MDPVTHTLVGASLAETGLKRISRFAAPTLIIGANLPDIDAVTYFIAGDLALYVRRGWTHGILAMAILPAMLGIGMWLAARPKGRGARGRFAPARAGALVGLAYLAVWTHPALDWLNSYGIRLLMPFYRQWFYGDALYIVDPWMWLMLSTAVVVAHTRRWFGVLGWAIAAAAATMVIVRSGAAPPAILTIWCAGLGSIAAVRVWHGDVARVPRVATFTIGMALVYIFVMIGATRLAERETRAWLLARGVAPLDVVPLPVPGNSFARDVIVVTPERYHFVSVSWLAAERLRVSGEPIERGEPDAIVRAALEAPQVRGLRNWIRFPAYEVRPIGNGYRVRIKDVRFSRMRRSGIGYQDVDVDRNLKPLTWPR
jgi:inner membrane protein